MEQLEGEDRVQRIARALERLSPMRRAVLIPRDDEALSKEEIARILGCALGTVKWHLHQARRHLRRALQAEHAEEEGVPWRSSLRR